MPKVSGNFSLVRSSHCGVPTPPLQFPKMIAICILVLSVAALIEFAVSQWRSMWLTVASQPLSDCLQTATGISPEAITADHFEFLLHSNEQLSHSSKQGNRWLKEVKIYFRAIRTLDVVCQKSLPALSSWAKNELVSCAKFAAAVLDQRLNDNLAYSSEMGSN
jgi:hypothetical protein